MTFRQFEEIDAWQTARSLARSTYRVSQNPKFHQDFGLRDQIRRAAVSIMANIAEGSSCRSDKEFARYLITARASTAEVQSHLYVALDEGYIGEEEFKRLYLLATKCSKQLGRLISYLLGQSIRSSA